MSEKEFDLYALADEFENGLNRQLNDPNILFKIWVNAGEYLPPVRDGNSVTYYVNGQIVPSASENLGTLIDGGAVSLVLTFLVPLPPPKTEQGQNATTLQMLEEGQYAFFKKISDTINGYFKIAENIKISAGSEGARYSVGLRAGVAVPGTVDMFSSVGEAAPLNVYIDLNYLKGGVNSRESKIALDDPNRPLPSLTSNISRSAILSTDVYAGKNRRQAMSSSSAIVIALSLPLTDEMKELHEFLIGGELNIARFVFYELEGERTVYWMTASEPAQATNEVSNVGLTINFVEIVDDAEFINVPAGYEVAHVEIEASIDQTLSVTSDRDCYAHIGDEIYELRANSAVEIALDERDFAVDEETGKYHVEIITNAAAVLSATVNGQAAEVKIDKEVE